MGRYKPLAATYMKPQWLALVALSVLLLVGIALQLAAPLIVRTFIDTVTAESETATDTLAFYALAFMAVTVIAQVVSVAETYVAEHVAWSATNQLRSDVALHCLQQDMSFHHSHTPGELIERIDGDIGVLANFFSRFVSAVLGHGLYLVGMLAVLFAIDWRVGLALTLFTIGAVTLLNHLRGVGQPAYKEYMQANADLMGFVEERLSATEDIRSSGAIPYSLHQLHTLLRRLFRKESVALLLASSMMWATTATLISVGTAIAFFLTARFFLQGAITIGTAYLIFSYTRQMMQPLEHLSEQMQDFQQAGAAVARVEQLLRLEPDIRDGPGAELPQEALPVEFRDVSFEYLPGEPALRGVSFRLEPGRSLGIVGRTGSGKTTIARLLLRLYDPTSGVVSVGDVDVREMKLSELRERISMVTQDVQIFHATVRENITVFRPDIPDERIVSSLRDLGLWEWYRRLPDGLDTMLASGGTGLSAGEAQLLALTRVFLLNPSVVILDEASSRLDPATERLIDQAVSRLLSGRTSLIIAHRLRTLERVDEILVLEDGTVREHGTRRQLMDDTQSLFSSLLSAEPDEVLALARPACSGAWCAIAPGSIWRTP